ncbi:MAG: hypothetical protein O8C63_09695 [Candidatus Methanoperedens sp.]|nr:hypothetical protein [Candidatus Methanoperedens sp.]
MSFAKNILVLVVIVGIIAGGILYVTRQDVEYINVQMNLTQFDNNSAPTIDNMTAFLVPVTKVSEPKGKPQAFTPGVIVKIFQTKEGAAEDISDWISVPYTGNGTYNIPVGIWKYPKKGEFVLINVRLVDGAGQEFTSVTYSTQLQ